MFYANSLSLFHTHPKFQDHTHWQHLRLIIVIKKTFYFNKTMERRKNQAIELSIFVLLVCQTQKISQIKQGLVYLQYCSSKKKQGLHFELQKLIPSQVCFKDFSKILVILPNIGTTLIQQMLQYFCNLTMLLVAPSAVKKNLYKVKCCSKGYLFRYRHVTLDRFLSTT